MRPVARIIAARRRTVVVLPFVPVTITRGTSPNSCHGTSRGAGSASTGQVRDPAPVPTLAASSSDRKAHPVCGGGLLQGEQLGSGFRLDQRGEARGGPRQRLVGLPAGQVGGGGPRRPTR